MNIPPLVAVLWEDAKQLAQNGVWVENDKSEYKPHLFYQVGFLKLDVPEGIQLVHTWHPDITSPPDQIPRGMIRSITYLAPTKPPRKRK